MRNRHKRHETAHVVSDKKLIYCNGEVLEVPTRLRVEKIYWAFPMDEILFSLWFRNFLQLDMMPWDDTGITLNTYLPEARNHLHEMFLQSTAQWMVMLDSDVLPPPNFVEKLMAHNLPIVGGWYKKKDSKGQPVVYDYEAKDNGFHWWKIREKPGVGLEKVDGAGAGCWLLKREVAEALGEKPYDMEHGGEDLDFCVKVKEAGFDIYIDWDVACAHAGVKFI